MKKTKGMREVNWSMLWIRSMACVVWLLTAAGVLFFGSGVFELSAMAAEQGMMFAVLAFCMFALAAGLLVIGVGAGVWMWTEADW